MTEVKEDIKQEYGRDEDSRITQLKKEGKHLYSISKINTYNDCPYAYYLTYKEKQKGENNCYGIAGGEIHDWLEDIQNGDMDIAELQTQFDNLIPYLELMGYDFPDDDIKNNWVYNIQHFIDSFEKVNMNMITEKLILFPLNDDIWFRGYVDIMAKDEDDLVILDWKTSSKFTGDKLLSASRQLLIYKYALDMTTDFEVDRIGWYMIKYVDIRYATADTTCPVVGTRKGKPYGWVERISKKIEKELKDFGYRKDKADHMISQAIKENSLESLPQRVKELFTVTMLEKDRVNISYLGNKRMVERRNIIKDFEKKIKSELLKLGYDDFTAEIEFENALKNNSFDSLPKEIQDKVIIEPCIKWFQYSQEDIDEALNYINETSFNILGSEMLDIWKPCDIFDKSNEFFCLHLCNHREYCKFLTEHKERVGIID